MVIDQQPQRATVCSAAAYESEDALSRDESQQDALRRFTETFITEYQTTLNALLEETDSTQK